jgi:hypothetical protein
MVHFHVSPILHEASKFNKEKRIVLTKMHQLIAILASEIGRVNEPLGKILHSP